MAPKSHTYIVEHLDTELEDWQGLEYTTISAESTSTSNKFLLSGLDASLLDHATPSGALIAKIPNPSKSTTSVEKLYPTPEARKRVCLLDPKGAKDLCPEDGDEFDAFLFGGILGDDPPRDRTADLRRMGFTGRRLGPEQMTTDTAVRTTRLVVQQGIKLDEVEYVDRPDIEIRDEEGEVVKGETIEMPFKYVKDKETGKAIMPEGMLELLGRDADKGILDLL